MNERNSDSPIENKAFLGMNSDENMTRISEQHKDYFQLAYTTFDYARYIRTKALNEVRNEERQKQLAGLFFTRILESSEAAVLLLTYGFFSEPQILLRVMLETTYLLKNTCKEKDFYIEFSKAYEKKRLKMMKVGRTYPKQLPKVSAFSTDDKRNKLAKKIEEEKIKLSQVKTFAENAGMIFEHDTYYSLLSEYVHTSPAIMEEYFKLDNNGVVEEIRYGPRTEEVAQFMIQIVFLLLEALSSLSQLFQLEDDDTLTDLYQNAADLAGRTEI